MLVQFFIIQVELYYSGQWSRVVQGQGSKKKFALGPRIKKYEVYRKENRKEVPKLILPIAPRFL